nr:MAG TPA: hypothetical protein [Crassvirales sp.]
MNIPLILFEFKLHNYLGLHNTLYKNSNRY